MANKENLIGETRMMKCGMNATCIAYRNNSDLDVEFEDGIIVAHRTKQSFYNGGIQHPTMKRHRKIVASCLGETRQMTNGMNATCIEYIRSDDITVQFEDGTIVSHTRKSAFFDGKIANPSIPFGSYANKPKSDGCLNLTIMQNCGMNATCIEYINSSNIVVEFEDGTIVRGRSKASFKKGGIQNPNLKKYVGKRDLSESKKSCLNETRMMNCGMNATCIKYDNYFSMDIKFEDGTIIKTNKTSFYRGTSKHPNINTPNSFMKKKSEDASCLGETRTMNNGQKATCIAYRKSSDCDFKFEDGTIVEHKKKDKFLSGNLKNPNLVSCLNESLIMNNGQIAKCIRYYDSMNIDVQFEDGTIVEHITKALFMRRQVVNPNWNIKSFPQWIVFYYVKKIFSDAINNYRPQWLKSRISGVPFEIDIWIPSIKTGIEYDGYPWHTKDDEATIEKIELLNNSSNIETLINVVEKDCIEHKSDKFINFLLSVNSSNRYRRNTENKLYKELSIVICKIIKLLKGIEIEILLDEKELDKIRGKYSNEIVGKTLTMHNGQKATCIYYRNSHDIDIQFEDGTIVEHKNKSMFMRGQVANPNYSNNGSYARIYEDLVGVEKTMNNGQKAICIRHNGAYDIDVQFEDGYIAHNVSKSSFFRGNVANHNLGRNASLKMSCLNETRVMKNGQKATCIRYGSNTDIDVQFEDGTIVEHKTKGCFNRGKIGNPNYEPNNCVGLEIIMRNGQKAKCIIYRSNVDIDIQFEDGTIVEHKAKSAFLKGQIRNPMYKKGERS